MTKSEFEEVNELKEILRKYKECEKYFDPNDRYCKSDIDKAYKYHRFPFNIFFNKKDDKTVSCNIDLIGWSGGKSIDVDIEFIKYCRVYFENKVKSLEAEIDSYFEKENCDND
jgi:hypothetical protein